MTTPVTTAVQAASSAGSFAWDLFFEFGILLTGLGILTRIAGKLRISPVPLYLLAGLLVSGGGFIPIDEHAELVPVIAQMGSISLLLLLGLEYSGPVLVRTVRRHSRSGLVDFAANALPGAAAGLILGWGWTGALVLAGVTYVSSSGIATQVLRDMKWRRNPEGASVIGILVIEDLMMAPYLPILAATLAGAGAVSGLISVGAALVVVGAALWLSVRHATNAQRFFGAADDTSGLILVVFGIALAAAAMGAAASFSPEVAAFLVGLLLTGEIAEQIRRRLDPIREVLAAVFFAYFGLSTDPAALPGVLLPAVALAIVTLGTKLVTGWYAGHVDGLGVIARLRAGALLGARGEFSVVIASLVIASPGLPAALSAFIAAYLITTAVTAPVLARFAEPVGWWLEQHPSRRRS